MPVYNGARFLPAQLDSLSEQTYVDWQVLISDDGSTDDSRAVLETFITANADKAHLFDGPQNGIAANIFSLIARVDPQTKFVAFCDQDDIWHADRLARACKIVAKTDAPSLYCSRTNLVDARGVFMRLSPSRARPPLFQNALVQNIASGNTMVLNQAGWHLLRDQINAAQGVAYHDWWAYQLVSGAGGTVFHDDEPSLDYRQHTTNVLGSAIGLPGRWRRLLRVSNRALSIDTSKNLVALQRSRAALSAECAAQLDCVTSLHDKGPFGRLRGVIAAGLYRQSRVSTLGLWFAALIGRF